MFEFLGDLIIGIILGIITIIILETYVTGGGGGFVRRGSQQDKNIDARVKARLAKGSCSSKAELQEWWDTYHPPK